MTCQWCKNYRRRKDGLQKCLAPDEIGVLRLVDAHGADGCARFDPRRSCTTCEYRCSPEEKASNMYGFNKCGKWKLRKLATWGGSRRFPPKGQSSGRATKAEKAGHVPQEGNKGDDI